MENQVTLSKREYDELREFKRLYETQKEVLENDEPFVIRISKEYHGDESLRVYSGKTDVKELFGLYSRRQDMLDKNLAMTKDNYKEDSEKLSKIIKILK